MGRLAKVLALVAVISIGAAVPAEAVTKVATKFKNVGSYGIDGVDNVSQVDGYLKSEKKKCIASRTVYASWWNGSTWVAYGNDVSDVSGFWAISGSAPYYNTRYGFVVEKVTLGNTVCKGAVVTGRFD